METFIQIAASIAGLLMAIAKFNEILRDPRKELMEHIKVREQLPEDSEHYQNVSDRIDRLLSRLYPEPQIEVEEIHEKENRRVNRDWKAVQSMMMTSLVSFVLFSWWTLWLLLTNISFWIILPSLMAVTSYVVLKVAIQTCFEEIDRVNAT